MLLVATLLLVVTASGCDVAHYEQPIGEGGGFGWVQWMVTQLGELLLRLSEFAGGHYIVGLFLLTMIIRIVGWPIYSKSTAMSANMQIAQPELEQLKQKYQDKKDEASQKKMQQEMLQIYRKYNINPLGCFLPLLQMPIFIAMYQVVRRLPLAADQYDHINWQFFFMDFTAESPSMETFNLSQHWINILLALIVGATMYFYQRYAMKKPDYIKGRNYPKSAQQIQSEKTMKFMTYFMVIMLTSISFTNLGIAFYWIVGNMFQFLQTYINRKKMHQKITNEKAI